MNSVNFRRIVGPVWFFRGVFDFPVFSEGRSDAGKKCLKQNRTVEIRWKIHLPRRTHGIRPRRDSGQSNLPLNNTPFPPNCSISNNPKPPRSLNFNDITWRKVAGFPMTRCEYCKYFLLINRFSRPGEILISRSFNTHGLRIEIGQSPSLQRDTAAAAQSVLVFRIRVGRYRCAGRWHVWDGQDSTRNDTTQWHIYRGYT